MRKEMNASDIGVLAMERITSAQNVIVSTSVYSHITDNAYNCDKGGDDSCCVVISTQEGKIYSIRVYDYDDTLYVWYSSLD